MRQPLKFYYRAVKRKTLTETLGAKFAIKSVKRKKFETENESETETEIESEMSGSESNDSDIEYVASSKLTGKTKARKTKVLTPAVCTALDRTQVSNEGAMKILAPFAQALNINLNDVTISTSTIQRSRVNNRTVRSK